MPERPFTRRGRERMQLFHARCACIRHYGGRVRILNMLKLNFFLFGYVRTRMNPDVIVLINIFLLSL